MRKVIASFFCCFFTISTALYAAQPLDSIGTANVSGKLCVRYLVSAGETIYRISTIYKVSVSDLIELNPELEAGLKVGQIISIPYNKSVVSTNKDFDVNSIPVSPQNIASHENVADNNTLHVVQPGETLYGLSKKYNVSVDELKSWNSFELKAGQTLIITNPNKSTKSAVSTTTTNAKKEPETKIEPTAVINSSTSTPTAKKEEQDNTIKPQNKPTAPKAAPVKVISNHFADTTTYSYDPTMQQVLIIPFDPYLYFSDADDEIAAASKIHRTAVRQVFRRRMNALLDHPGYENIHLLGGKANDSISDLNKIYSSVTYNYQEIINNPNYIEKTATTSAKTGSSKSNKTWIQKQKEKITTEESSNKATTARDNGKYFGVIVRNPEFFNYFNRKYNTDYYIFINQFEVKTNYENCLDRSAHNFDRTFTTHFSIFNKEGKQIAGNKFKLLYNSNSNNVQQIVSENMLRIADRIIAELPTPSRD